MENGHKLQHQTKDSFHYEKYQASPKSKNMNKTINFFYLFQIFQINSDLPQTNISIKILDDFSIYL